MEEISIQIHVGGLRDTEWSGRVETWGNGEGVPEHEGRKRCLDQSLNKWRSFDGFYR